MIDFNQSLFPVVDIRYPNLRGSYVRSDDKLTRLSTHLAVVRPLMDTFPITHVLEHGMGRSSTAFFHGCDLRLLLSVEDDPQWQTCESCERDDEKDRIHYHHVVSPMPSDDETLGFLLTALNTDTSLALLDGPGPQRLRMLEHCMKAKVRFIVFHDAETLSSSDLNRHRELSRVHGYFPVQYIGANPETSLYVLLDQVESLGSCLNIQDFVQL